MDLLYGRLAYTKIQLLHQVLVTEFLMAFEVGDGQCQFQRAVGGAVREVQSFDGLQEQLLLVVGQATVGFDFFRTTKIYRTPIN